MVPLVKTKSVRYRHDPSMSSKALPHTFALALDNDNLAVLVDDLVNLFGEHVGAAVDGQSPEAVQLAPGAPSG